jgi:hypothetical protein
MELDQFAFKEIGHNILGPNRNSWGYVYTIGIFARDDIIIKTITPRKTKIIKRFSCWNDAADYVELINADRRY